jgi:hypothetical protein
MLIAGTRQGNLLEQQEIYLFSGRSGHEEAALRPYSCDAALDDKGAFFAGLSRW